MAHATVGAESGNGHYFVCNQIKIVGAYGSDSRNRRRIGKRAIVGKSVADMMRQNIITDHLLCGCSHRDSLGISAYRYRVGELNNRQLFIPTQAGKEDRLISIYILMEKKVLKLKKLRGNVLSQPTLKNILGGYDLPEVVIECGQYSGKCWKWIVEGHYLGFEYGRCTFSGKMSDYCAKVN